MAESVEETYEQAAQVMYNQLIELFDSESEEETEDVDIPQELSDFLTIGTKGPRLDEQTVRFLCENGVTGLRSFLLYSQQSFQDMVSPILTVELPGISRSNGLCDVKTYGDYIFQHSLVDAKAIHIDFESIDIESYQLYLRLH